MADDPEFHLGPDPVHERCERCGQPYGILRRHSVQSLMVVALWTPAFATIRRLLFRCGPSAIVWCVVTAGINPVDGVLRTRTHAHVSEELVELLPAGSDRDASATIVRVLLISASVQH